MLSKLFETLFCKHQWETHAKEHYEWSERKIIEETKFWVNPEYDIQEYSSITEILICKNCGKVKKLEY